MKERAGIVTDTTTSVLPDLAVKLQENSGVRVVTVPSIIRWQSQEEVKDTEADPERFEKELSSGPLLGTSNANAAAYLEAYETLIKEGYKEMISIHSDQRLTGGIQSAQTAVRILEDKRQEAKIYLLDSKSVSVGAGLLVLAAIEGVEGNRKTEEVVNALAEQANNTRIFLAPTDPDYLVRSARRRLGIKGWLQAKAAQALHVSPIFTLDGKDLVVKAKVRGQAKLNRELIRQVKIEAEGRLPLKQALVTHTEGLEAAKDMVKLINESQELGVKLDEEKDIWDAGKALAVYAGLGVRALAFLLKQES